MYVRKTKQYALRIYLFAHEKLQNLRNSWMVTYVNYRANTDRYGKSADENDQNKYVIRFHHRRNQYSRE